MAIFISRKVNHFRYLYRSISSSQPQIIENLHRQPPFTLLHSALVPREIGTQSLPLALYQRFLFSTSTSSENTNSASEASKSEAKVKAETNSSGKNGSSGESNESSYGQRPNRGGPITWLGFALLIASGVGLIMLFNKEKRKHIEVVFVYTIKRVFRVKRNPEDGLFLSGVCVIYHGLFDIYTASEEVKQGPSVGKAAIGGPFSLIDHYGKSVTEKDFLGQWSLLYFGFTHCPDICPDELQKLAAAIDKIKHKAGLDVVPVFISVDPERDTVEQVGEYVKEFHPKLIGLTGTPDEIRNVARAYRVYYMKTEQEGSDYLVDHSIVMYLMDPDMQFVKFFGKSNDVDGLTDGIIKEIKNYDKR